MVSSLRRTEQPQQMYATGSIVVGADVRGRSTSAVVWAAEEAQRTGHPLLVVTALDQPRSDHDAGQHGMASLAHQLTLSDVAFHEAVGKLSPPARCSWRPAQRVSRRARYLPLGRVRSASGSYVVVGVMTARPSIYRLVVDTLPQVRAAGAGTLCPRAPYQRSGLRLRGPVPSPWPP
jgi:hypothetical protein